MIENTDRQVAEILDVLKTTAPDAIEQYVKGAIVSNSLAAILCLSLSVLLAVSYRRLRRSMGPNDTGAESVVCGILAAFVMVIGCGAAADAYMWARYPKGKLLGKIIERSK